MFVTLKFLQTHNVHRSFNSTKPLFIYFNMLKNNNKIITLSCNNYLPKICKNFLTNLL